MLLVGDRVSVQLKQTKPEGSGESVTSLRVVAVNSIYVTHLYSVTHSSQLSLVPLSEGVANSQHAVLGPC